MKTLCLGLLVISVVAVWSPALTPALHPRTAWIAATAPIPVFLQQTGGPVWMPSSPGGGSNRSHLHNSAMPNNIPVLTACSVDTTDMAPCSAQEGTAVTKCSAHNDSNTACSAVDVPGGTHPANCSALGGKVRCSVQAPSVQRRLTAGCSALSDNPGAILTCSVLASGKKAACSAQNPSTVANVCSAWAENLGSATCSVLRSSPSVPAYCSVGFQAGPTQPDICSTYLATTVCSIQMGNKGVCSNLKQAPSGSCSAHSTTGKDFCSVIGGTAGTLCRQ